MFRHLGFWGFGRPGCWGLGASAFGLRVYRAFSDKGSVRLQASGSMWEFLKMRGYRVLGSL